MSISETVPVAEIVMDRVLFAIQRRIPKVMARDAVNLDTYLDHMTEEMVYSLRYEVLGVHLDERVVRYPADWWQALRARWLPMWWLRRRPVRWTEVRMELKALYPQLPINETPIYHVGIEPSVES